MVYGVCWLGRYHTVYFIIFSLGALLIWSCAGGAICRTAAVHFARDEKLTMMQSLRYAWGKLFGGFFLAPCIPLVFILITALLLVLGGLVLRIPILGDLIAGLAFGLAIFGGFVISILLLGLLVGGSLFFPAVAVEGSDAFDAFSRGLSYPLSKPLKAILYAVIALVFASVCWVFVNLFTFVMLTITRALVGFGTSPFGWLNRGEEGETLSKLDLLWPLTGPNAMYSWPDWGRLGWYEYISAVFIGVYVLMVIGLMWSFLASFYFSGSTVIYYLLRRDVDGTDLDSVYIEEEEEDDVTAPASDVTTPSVPASKTAPAQPSSGVSLPVVQAEATPAPTPTPDEPTEPSKPSTTEEPPPTTEEPPPTTEEPPPTTEEPSPTTEEPPPTTPEPDKPDVTDESDDKS
jgi:hypothetical protein